MNKAKGKSKSIGSLIELSSIVLNKVGLTIMLPAMTLVICVDVTMRKFFNAPLHGGYEIAGFSLAVVFYFSLSYSWISKGQVRFDLLINHFQPRMRYACEALAAAFWLLFFGLLVFWLISWDIPQAIRFQDISIDAQIPLWIIKTLIAIGAIVFCAELLFSLIRNIINIGRHGS
jgi:TRAP-type C4-dicarboxylate transport system permease small subunit